jgi:hypothetical protein
VRGVVWVLGGGGGGGWVPFGCKELPGSVKGSGRGRVNLLVCRREVRHSCIKG